ncbi:DUF5320 domain-containing protein [Clostridium tyrobutyricum]|jgi:hypothetical protein|uniref:DUF5320 domain-containing protein n=1 Tax=Clostridium tyrobutyricum TaxID=1519 RepID=UPI00031707A6|nr:DUF5320 domain-containing protein [Clostridium tyrobutyricum]MEA5009483.1 DUF5320 domain-containing protein [Clostridium tyrobutyricum]QCH29360.1 hypothetical protein EZN00_02993 [Clostridium tyrobutyricum]
MPRRDGTGPIDAGSMTGRGLGLSTGANAVRYGAGLGMRLGLGLACRRGFGSGFAINQTSSETKKSCSMNRKPCCKIDSKLLISN